MIIDTSALVAMLEQEPEAERIVRALASTPERTLSAANLLDIAAGVTCSSTDGCCLICVFPSAQRGACSYCQ